MSKNIGGSILPSSSPEILTPLPFKNGQLVVIPDEEKDTHRLEFRKNKEIKILASHPNGYSCHNLAIRIINKTFENVQAQADFIVACGGTADFIEIHSIYEQ